MTYALGIDLGTTYSAAAVHRDGRAHIVELGTRSASIPSVVFLRDDETVLAGEAAQRRAASEPHRVAREFKRRIGDPTPVLLGGAPYSAEALTARLLGWIVDQVTEREGGPPASVAITHPANWGPYKIDLLGQAIRLAGIDHVELMSEPEAAVRHYATNERVDTGSVIAVYDLGGGTFDAALLRKTETGFEPLGRPEGIERLGGIDFDAAVLGHVVRSLDGVVEALDQDDPGTVQALSRLRQDCIDAKEGLSSDTDISIPVLLPNVQTEVRLTRSEFEAMIRPSLADSLTAMRRALDSADISADDVDAVLLVGGSSRVPLVAQLVSNEFGRPIAIDADPKHAIALGAALVAGDHMSATPPPAASDEPDSVGEVLVVPQTSEPVTIAAEEVEVAHTAEMPPTTPSPSADADRHSSKSKLPILVGAGLATVVAVVAAVVIIGGSGGDSPEQAAAAPAASTTSPATTPAATAIAAPTLSTTPTSAAPASTLGDVVETTRSTAATTTTTEPVPTSADVEPTTCPDGPERTACITGISIDADGGLIAPFVATGYTPELEPAGFHVHFYFDSVTNGDERNAGSEGSGGDWRLWDGPTTFAPTGGDGGRPGYTIDDARAVDATQLCSVVATSSHAAVVGTGNCIDLPTDDEIQSVAWLDGYGVETRNDFVDACREGAGTASTDPCSCTFERVATTVPFDDFVIVDIDPDSADDATVAAMAAAIALCA